MPPWQAWVLAATVVAGAFLIFPYACDGEYVLFDPVWYAGGAHRYDADVVKSHHLLFHLTVMGVASVADSFSLEDPGHVATRTLSGLGAAGILLALVALAGPRRWRVGAGLFIALLATRAFFLEAFLGENVLPATAVALWALLMALRPRTSLPAVGALTVAALLFRQDAIFMLPSILLALWWRLPPDTRLKRLVVWTGICGAVTLAVYLTVAMTLEPGAALRDDDKKPIEGVERITTWMWGVAKDDYATERNHVAAHAVSFGESITGQQWPPFESELHIWVGVLFLALLVGMGVWFRGTSSWERLAVVAALTVVIRFAFYAWFEPGNAEWTLCTWVLIAAVVARAARGEPRSRMATRVMAGVFLTVVGAATLRSHLPSTLTFREHRFERAADVVEELLDRHDPDRKWRVCGFQNRGWLALHIRKIRARMLPTDFDVAKKLLMKEVAADRVPTLVLMDVAVQTGMPHDLRALRLEWTGKVVDEPPFAKVLWSSDELHGIHVIGFLVP